jgi:L-fuconolactonase
MAAAQRRQPGLKWPNEVPLVPDFPIVDAHVHIYDPRRLSYPWMAPLPTLDGPHLLEDYDRLTAGVDIEAMVFVEVDVAPGAHLAEVEFVQEQSRIEPRLRAVVASMPLESGRAVEADLAAYSRFPLARGVRRLIERHDREPGWCLRDGFVAGVKLLPRFGFTFDLCVFHAQLAEATELVRRCPEVSFVLDHIGKPGIRAGLWEPWASGLRAIAACPNVCCKISGVVTEADHAAWTEAQAAPYIAHAIDCFGFDRVMFGGDWPVSELATRYSRWVALVDAVTSKASSAERRKLFRDNAVAFYRL